ncbi:MAG: potassium transporter TrkA [Campylobacterales bacterium]|nr:potassium transporter TrkA [Campylobacterales bacterium]
MKKILIIADGIIGAHFIDRVIATHSSENVYHIIEPKERHHPAANPSRFSFHSFDPTSFYKISDLLKREFVQVIITMQSRPDIENTIKNIRTCNQTLRIIVLDQFDMEREDKYTHYINANELLASRLIDYLPNVPVIAQNVGKGEGEIMEVLVPFASSFVYRHIGVIEQKNWRIVAIYRNNELKLPTPRTMIHPNDLLLLVGEPSVLKSVYRTIKRELGQFPAPFGTNLYCFIDMDCDDPDGIIELVQKALYLNSRFASYALIIKVINPGNIDLLWQIKECSESNVHIDICYRKRPAQEVILEDMKRYHVGLLIVSRRLFAQQKMRRVLYECNVPVLKLSEKSLNDLNNVVMILGGNRDFERVSTTIFDISEQMGYNMELVNYTHEFQQEKAQVVEHIRSLATIFSRSIKVTELAENPIRALSKRDNFLQCLPFHEKMVPTDWLAFASIDTERLYMKLDGYHQIFIPVRI